MSDYVRSSSTFFGDKDTLASGNANKIIKGSEFDTEFNSIATAVNTKYDSADRGAASGIAPLDGSSEVPAANLNLSSATEAATLTGSTVLSPGVFTDAANAWLTAEGGVVGDIANLVDPNEDAFLFWDDSAGVVDYLKLPATSGLAITTTNLNLDISGLTDYSTSTPTTADGFLMDDGGTMKRVGWNDGALLVNPVGTTTDTIGATDMNTYIRYTSASAVAVTLNTSTGKVGNFIIIEQGGAGAVTISGTATLNGALGTDPNGQYAVIMLVQVATDTWTVFGNAA